MTVSSGEIHALLGENGAGKSTLVSIAAGILRADSGRIRLRGRDAFFRTPRDARRGGLALVPQHDLLVEAATVAENLALLDVSAPFLEPPAARRSRVRRLAERFALDLGEADAPVAGLPVGTRQRIEIAGALAADPAILILDEPTAVLSPDETASLFASLRGRADSGKAVVLITHRLAEVFEAADRLTLLARGRTVKECAVSETTVDEIGDLLLGAAEKSEGQEERTTENLLLSGGCPAAAASGEPVSRPAAVKGAQSAPRSGPGPLTAGGRGRSLVLEVEGFVPSGSPAPPVSFSLKEADLLVLLAIDGNGADRLARCVAGMDRFSGRIWILGRYLSEAGDPRAFRAAGGRFVPADRRAEGLVAPLSLAENLALPSPPGRLFLDGAAMAFSAGERLRRHGIRAESADAPAASLSGGNQQKLVLARELDDRRGPPRLLVAVHPTRGLDLSAAAAVRDRIGEARREGTAVLVVGSDPEEARLFGGTLRVVYRGALSGPLPAETPIPALGRRMAGLPS